VKRGLSDRKGERNDNMRRRKEREKEIVNFLSEDIFIGRRPIIKEFLSKNKM
jgi:hypothetical protein